jgi:glucose-1-phosphate thymidylyltransferase
LQAGNFIETIEERQGLMVACLEEIAFNKGFITKDQLQNTINKLSDNSYKYYLEKILKGDNERSL